jgi:hypothetical protein
LYAYAHTNLGPLLLSGILEFPYDEYIESRMLQITRIRKIAHGSAGTTGVIPSEPNMKNPGRMPGFFIAYNFSFAKQA